MEPSTLREVLIERPNVHWDDIGGLDEAKQEMRESIEWPLKMNKLFAHFDARPPRGIMLYGPPGSGDSQVTERVISQILTEMDGLEELHNVTVIAATNRMDLVDTALLRPGRFDRHIYISPPDLATRRAILEIHTKKKPLGKDVDLDDLAKRTDKYTGEEIAAVCNEASMLAIREYALKFPKLDESALKKVSVEKRHFDAAMKKIQPQTGDASLYSRMPARFPRSPEVS